MPLLCTTSPAESKPSPTNTLVPGLTT